MPGRKEIFSFCLIALAYWFAYQGYESNYFSYIKPILKHGINYMLIIGVASIGYNYFSTQLQKWASDLWLLMYAFVIILIGVLGAIDLVKRFNSQNFRDLVGYLRMFFTGPIPFSVLLFLSKSSKPLQKKRNN